MDTQRTAAALGVDFGTHHTVATVLRLDGRRHQLLFEGNPLLPSGIYIGNDASILVGRDAAREGRRHPSRYERNPKLRIDSPSILLGDKEIPIREAVSAVIGRALTECERVAGPPRRVTVTVPAGWGPSRRHVVADAAASAGAAELTLLPEPVAAARYFVEVLGRELPPGRPLVVFDLGAGTFDVSAVARTAAGYDVLAVDGSDRIGGHYLDQAVVEYLGGRYEASEDLAERWRSLMDPQSGAERQRLRLALYDEVRDAKERLSRATTADIAVPGFAAEELLTRSELELLARPLLEQAAAMTKSVLREAGLEAGGLAGIFMVGGASRMPLATTLLHRRLGVAPTLIEEPELVVSEGAVTADPAASAPAPAPAPLAAAAQTASAAPPVGSVLPPAPSPPRRSPILLLGVVAVVLALAAAAGLVLRDHLGPSGTITGLESGGPSGEESTGPAETGADGVEAAAWDSVTVTAVDATASSVTVGTDADPALSGCAARVDGAALHTGLECDDFFVDGLHASSDYVLELFGPGGVGGPYEPIQQLVSTDVVYGEVYWDCPQTRSYCREQGGEPGIRGEADDPDAIGYAAVGEVFELNCYTGAELITPRGDEGEEGYWDYHPGKAASGLMIQVEYGDSHGYIPFVWLIVDEADLDSTGELPAC